MARPGAAEGNTLGITHYIHVCEHDWRYFCPLSATHNALSRDACVRKFGTDIMWNIKANENNVGQQKQQPRREIDRERREQAETTTQRARGRALNPRERRNDDNNSARKVESRGAQPTIHLSGAQPTILISGRPVRYTLAD